VLAEKSVALDEVEKTIAAIVHYFGNVSLRLLNKAFAYVALKMPELAQHVVVGEHGYIIEGWRERLAKLEAAGLVHVVGGGKWPRIEKAGSFEIPGDLLPILERAKKIVEKYGVEGLRRLVEKKTLLSGVEYEFIGHKMTEVLEYARQVREEIERNRAECPWCPTVEEFLQIRRRLEHVSD